MSVTAVNPILPGFYPDPSICAVGEDFYIVNSTFSYFPGLPVLHSRDLAHWEQIGNVMERASQLPLKDSGHSQGLFAPTIRYHEGTFYVICTNVSHGGNYVVTAKDPAGPWSEPHYLEGADGIDPSLFFDDDGKCYYIGTHPNPEGCKYNGDYYIWIRELDLEQMKLVGETWNVWNGAMKNIVWPEGPHLYKKDGWYYIMNAEGGTGPEHAVTICRSRNLLGPYENNFCNPILTHRHLGKEYPIRYVGHGDLVETVNGEWYMVMLAVRPLEGYTTMGRETFLAKVIWENDWPVVNPGVGMLTKEVKINLPGVSLTKEDPFGSRTYAFGGMKKLPPEFLTLRNPGKDMYRLTGEGLELSFGAVTLKEKKSPSYVALRQQHHSFRAQADLLTDHLTEGRRAGLALMQSNDYHLRTELCRMGEQLKAEVIFCRGGSDTTVCSVVIGSDDIPQPALSLEEVQLVLTVEGLSASLELWAPQDGQTQGAEKALLCRDLDIRDLSTEVAGGFVGCTVGLYAVADTEGREGAACFRRLSYQPL